MSRDDLFNTNACTVMDITKVIAVKCPKALVAIITNPVNTCVPIAAEIMKKVSKIYVDKSFIHTFPFPENRVASMIRSVYSACVL